MRLGVLNAELSIFTIEGLKELESIQEKYIKVQMPEGAKSDDLTFFYISSRDWIVLNRNHALYEYYATIISCYLELSVEGRRESVRRAPTDGIRKALEILDNVIMHRSLMYGKKGRAAV